MSLFRCVFCSLFGWLQRAHYLIGCDGFYYRWRDAVRGQQQKCTTTTTKHRTNKVAQVAIGDNKNNCTTRGPFIYHREIADPPNAPSGIAVCVFVQQLLFRSLIERPFQTLAGGFFCCCCCDQLLFQMDN